MAHSADISTRLEASVSKMLARTDFADEPQVEALTTELLARYGDAVEAIVLYGSFTRGQRDTLLDLYVLLRDLRGLSGFHRLLARLPPNVYNLNVSGVRAKVAVMTFDQIERGVRRDISPYFWARFAQPSAIVYQRDPAARARFTGLVCNAALRLFKAANAAEAVPGDAAAFWRHTFQLTYGAELRTEQASRYRALYEANPQYFDELHGALAALPTGPDTSWRVRQLVGKLLSFSRLIKSAFTFDDPVDYLLWKIERHSGVRETATPLQHRYPLVFAWPVVWRLYRKGAFR